MLPVSISFALLTHNEGAKLGVLLRELMSVVQEDEEIVVVDDYSEEPTKKIFESYINHERFRFFERCLNKNFAAQRNFLKAQCRGKIIFLFDPDEELPQNFLAERHKITAMMNQQQIDACAFPRLNFTVDQKKIFLKSKKINDADGFPDYQFRVIRNDPHIRWWFRLHERLVGMKRVYFFPATKVYAFVHEKHEAKIQDQMSFYNSIPFRFWRKLGKSIAKRCGLLGYERVVSAPPF